MNFKVHFVNKKMNGLELYFIALKHIQNTQGLTQLQIAEKAGLESTFVSRLKKVANPRFDTLSKIAEAAGTNLTDMLALGRAIVEGEKPPINPEVAAYLDKALAVLEGPKGDALKTVIESMLKE